MYEKIFEMIYYGKGFGFTELYEMPVIVRDFYYMKLAEIKEKEAKIKTTSAREMIYGQ